MPRTRRQAASRGWRTALMAVILVVLGGVASAAPAWAHGEGETEEGYVLVQQALGHLAHEPNMAGVESAMEKIGDTLATEDQDGVNVAQVKDAQAALEAGKVTAGQALLQQSITAAVSQLKPATGQETGTTVVPGELPGRGSLNGLQWAFLGISVLLLLAGSALASRFGPVDNIAALRRRIAAPQSGRAPAGTLKRDES